MRELMTVINSISVFFLVAMSLLTAIYCYRGRRRRMAMWADNKCWYFAVYTYGVATSVWASNMALLFEGFWMYPLTLGLCIGAMIIATYLRNVVLDHLTEN